MIEINVPLDCGRQPYYYLGQAGDNLARAVVMDLTPWVEEYGTGSALVRVNRPDGTVYEAAQVTFAAPTLTMAITNVETAYAGQGTIEVQYFVGDVLVKSTQIGTLVGEALEPTGDAPDPYQSWLDALTALAAQVSADAQRAEDAVASMLTAQFSINSDGHVILNWVAAE